MTSPNPRKSNLDLLLQHAPLQQTSGDSILLSGALAGMESH